MNISIKGTVKSIIVPRMQNAVHLLIEMAEGAQYLVCFSQFVTEIKQYLQVDDQIIVTGSQIEEGCVQGQTLEFLYYKPKDQRGSLPQQLESAYRKTLFMRIISMELGIFYKQQGDSKNSHYFISRAVSLNFEIPKLAELISLVSSV